MNNLEDGNATLPRWKIEKLMEEQLKEFHESEIKPIQSTLSENTATMYRIDGGITTLKWIAGVTGFALVIVNIIVAIKKAF